MSRQQYFAPRFGQSAGNWGNQSWGGMGTVQSSEMHVGSVPFRGATRAGVLPIGDMGHVGAPSSNVSGAMSASANRLNAWHEQQRQNMARSTGKAPAIQPYQPQSDRLAAFHQQIAAKRPAPTSVWPQPVKSPFAS